MKKIILLVLITIALVGCNQKVNALTIEEAQEIALKEVAGKVLKAKEDKEDGVSYYDFTIITDTEKYEVEIDANSGYFMQLTKRLPIYLTIFYLNILSNYDRFITNY